ncbi:protein tyrosine phosphatase family protein [Halovulum sp. GXIMD14793]
MELRYLTEQLAVSGQITPEDVPALAAQGIRTLICNRPDNEAPDQPAFALIAAEAAKAGAVAHYLPVTSGADLPDQVQAFADILENAPGPVLAYCRSGARSTALWQMSQDLPGRVAG